MDEAEVACLLCRSIQRRTMLSFDKPDQYEEAAGIATPEGYYRSWVQCQQCGFHYSMYSRDPEVLDRLYTSAYRDKQSGWRNASAEETFRRVIALPKEESETKVRVDWLKTQISQMWNAKLCERRNGPMRMLDVGGATGVFAYEFQDADWTAHVVDPDENGRFLQDKFNIPFLAKKYEPGLFGFRFDLISLVFVLDHLRTPLEFLKVVYKDLNPSALVYLEVPDEAAFRLKPGDDDIFNSCHLWMFGPKTLTTALDTCGYEVFAANRTQTRRGHYALMVLAGRKR